MSLGPGFDSRRLHRKNRPRHGRFFYLCRQCSAIPTAFDAEAGVFMDLRNDPLDELVEQFERRLLPELEAVKGELASLWPGFDISTFSQRHAHVVHTIGLWCAVSGHSLLTDDASRGVHVNIFGGDRFSVRGFVSWNSSFRCGRDTVSNSYELMTRSYYSERPADLLAFLQETPLLIKGLRRAFRRGRPPGRLLRLKGYILGELDWR